jgi:hypothetical protein
LANTRKDDISQGRSMKNDVEIARFFPPLRGTLADC